MSTKATFLPTQHILATGATTFLSLPRELRDLVYSSLFNAVYTQIRVDVQFRLKPSDRLGVLQTSRQLREEGSIVLYGENLFCFQPGSTSFDPAFLVQRTTDLMQDIEIVLCRRNLRESIQILEFFGGFQISRKSWVIKLDFDLAELIHPDMLRTLERLTGFNVLSFEVDESFVDPYPQSKFLIRLHSCLLRWVQGQLTQALGPGTFINKDYSRRLIFHPQDHLRRESIGCQAEASL